jgi:uncharacterized protein (TIGR03435 family)
MLQHLLEDRFNLKYHYETKQMRGYELVVARPDPRLAKSTVPPDPSVVVQGMCFEVKNGVPVFGPNAPTCGFSFGGNVIWHGRNRTMSGLAGSLADKMNAPVIDSTGLEGPYDYTLTYPKQPADESGESPDIPFMLDALQQQLGLKLLPLKNVPVQVFVLDSVNKMPSAN